MAEIEKFVTLDHPAFTSPEKTAIVFPGQGIQHVGMGRDIFDNSDAARIIYGIADEKAWSSKYFVTDVSFNGPKNVLDDCSQTAILTRNAAYYAAIIEELGEGLKPAAVAGYSLAEFNAIVAAGSIKFADMFSAVESRRQGSLRVNSLNAGGEMAVILNIKEEDDLTPEHIRFLNEGLLYLRGKQDLFLALSTSRTHFVVAGTNEALKRAEDWVRSYRGESGIKEIICKKLPIDGAYHTPLMKEALAELEEALKRIPIIKARIPIIANTTGHPIEEVEDIINEIKAHLISPVDWYKSIRVLYKLGIKYIVEPGDKPLITSVSLKEGRVLLPVKGDHGNGIILAHILMPEEEAYAT